MTAFEEKNLKLPSMPPVFDPSRYEGVDIRHMAAKTVKTVSPEELFRVAIEEEKARARHAEEEATFAGQALREAAVQLKESALQWKEQSVEEVTRLALFLAEKILEDEIKTRPELLVSEVRKVLEASMSEAPKVLFLNAKDIEYLQEHQKDFLRTMGEEAGVVIKEDVQFPRGVCRLDTPVRRFEANVFKKFKQVKDELGADKGIGEGSS